MGECGDVATCVDLVEILAPFGAVGGKVDLDEFNVEARLGGSDVRGERAGSVCEVELYGGLIRLVRYANTQATAELIRD
jgi:hypothetical protein